jgi:hypothetical protein
MAVVHASGKVSQIYCHYDGYVEHNGKILVEHYYNLEAVEALIALGDLSVLGKYLLPNSNEVHTFEDPVKDVCIAYGRDRGETSTAPAIFDDTGWLGYEGRSEEYDYIFKNGEWFLHGEEKPLSTLVNGAKASNIFW